VPGLIGTILTMTMVMMTGLAMTRERERGTMENLLATPVRPVEVMLGKILPYVVVGYIQLSVILAAGAFLFEVPMEGSFLLLMGMIGVFMLANLAVGFTFSTLARNQMQALQATFFFFLPSMLLSGFMFPFRGMPGWAQHLGELLPLTHFLRIVRGILLKGNGFLQVLPELWPLLAFLAVAGRWRWRGIGRPWIEVLGLGWIGLGWRAAVDGGPGGRAIGWSSPWARTLLGATGAGRHRGTRCALTRSAQTPTVGQRTRCAENCAPGQRPPPLGTLHARPPGPPSTAVTVGG
jgi:ABC-type uncharacterized transport system permease subunit